MTLMTERTPEAIDALIRRETAILVPPLTPELRFFGAADFTKIWGASEAELDAMALPPPFWAFAWPGGQALARYALDHPELVDGRRVAALAAGAGVEAVAAARSGAARVIANDIDPVAQRAMALNAALNHVALEIDGADWLAAGATPPVDLLMAGDIFYEKAIADRLAPLLRAAAAAGVDVWIGEGGRPYRLTQGVARLAAYDVPTSVELEDVACRRAEVLRLLPG